MNNLKKLFPSSNNYSLWIIGLLFFWFISVFLIIPNIHILLMSIVSDGKLSFEPIEKILNSERALNSIKNSFILAFILPITVNIVGIFIVLVTEYFDIKGAKVLRIGYMTTLVFSGIILASGYLFVYGQNGWFTSLLLHFFPNLDPNWFEGFPAVLFMMTFACTSSHMLFFRNSIRSIDFQTVEAAKNMGASQYTILKTVLFPTLMPIIITLTVMASQIGLGAFSGPLMVGGENFQTIAPMILTFASRPGSRDIAAVLSVFLGLFQMILLILLTRNEKKGNYISISKTQTKIAKQKINNKFTNVIVHITAWILWLIYVIPVISVILFSFTDTSTIASGKLKLDSFTLKNYIFVLTDTSAIGPFITSAIYSALTAIIVVLLTLIAARLIVKYNNRLTAVFEYVLYIPWLLPGVMIALGLMLTYDKQHIYMFNKVLLGTFIILLIAYVVVSIPQSLRIIKSAYFSFDSNLEDAAKNLGANTIVNFWRVILPVILPTALAIAALTFNAKLADYDLSAFLSQPLHPTLGILIRSNASPTATPEAQAINLVYSVILMFISAIVIYFVYERKTNK